MDATKTRAIVTGGASGIGRAVTRRLLRAGARVAVLDLERSIDAAQDATDEIWLPTDITDETSVSEAVSTAAERLGGINALISCAGIAPPTPVRDRSGEPVALQAFRSVVEVNLIGLYDVLRHCVAMMARNEQAEDGERGVIVNLASIAAFEGQSGQSAYAASKGAVVALTLPLARELSPLGIRVMTVCPGIVDTPMLAGMSDAVRDRLVALPVFPHRLAEPDELAEFVLSCLTIRYLNGETVRIDGAARMPAR